MTIHKIESNERGCSSCATVTLYYSELQKLSSALCKLQEDEEFSKRKDFWKLARDIHFLFDVVKNGCVDDWTFESGYWHTLKENGKDIALEDVLVETEKEVK